MRARCQTWSSNGPHTPMCAAEATVQPSLPQKIVAGAKVAADVTEELSKFGDADFDAVTRLSEQFLMNVRVRKRHVTLLHSHPARVISSERGCIAQSQDAQAILQDVIRQLPPAAPVRGRSYIQRLQASRGT